MKNKKTYKKGLFFAVLMFLAAGGVVIYLQHKGADTKSENILTGYEQEAVKRGTVAVGITENGSVTYGTVEQVFEVAEIEEGDSLDTDTSTNTTAGTVKNADMGAAGMNPGGMNMGESDGSATNSTASSGTTTTLEVEAVYAKTGQNVTAGDKILKITEESINDYKEQLEAAVKSAQLSVKQEEINLEQKKAEAGYNYQMNIINGETAEETYNATIKQLDKAVSDIEEEIEDKQEDIDTYQYYVDCGYDYDDDLKDAQDEMETLEDNLLIAKNSRTTGTLEAKQTYDTAVNNYKYAQQLHEIELDGVEDDLNDAKDTLSDAQEALDSFTGNLGDGIVYAAYSGMVTEVAYAAGDTITNEATIVTYTDSESVTITVSVEQEDISGISTGMKGDILLDAYPSEIFTGTVDSISTSSTAGSSTVNYEVSVLFTGDISKVYSGMTGNVTFAGETVQDTLYIPNRAVYMQGAASYVKVLDEDGNIQEKAIKTGFSNGSVVAVDSGLEEGEIILIG